VFEEKRYTVTIREEGVTVARGFFCYPRLPEKELCAVLAEECETWLRTSLAEKAIQEYRADPSPKKRFFFPSYDYRFDAKLLDRCESEGILVFKVTLSRCGKPLACHESSERIRLHDLIFLPPKRKKHGR